MEKWVTTVPAITLIEGELLGVVALGHALALIRHEGRLYAFPDRCPHRGAPFSTAGRLSGGLLLWASPLSGEGLASLGLPCAKAMACD